jgi:hypothetical protein
MARFTQGEWQSNGGLVRTVDANNITVAKIATLEGEFGSEEKAANGQLIAAAPALFLALHNLASLIESIRDDAVSARMGFGASEAEKKERVRVLTGYIEANAEKIDEALEVAITALAKAPAPEKQFETA